MAYGITEDGFLKKTLETLLAEIDDRQRAEFGATFDASENTAIGQLNGIFSSGLAEAWELLEECFHGFDPDAAAGYALTALAGLTGTPRRGATASISRQQSLNLDAGATVADGALIAHSARPDIVFAVVGPVTNSGGSPADIECEAVCTQTGPIGALAGSLTVIVNPASGWNSTTNVTDAVQGRDIDSDIVLRQRREDQLALRGGSTVAAIKADLLAIADVRSVEVIENTTDTTDVDGLPPHSFEAVIDDGDVPAVDDDDLAQAIWDSKPAGIATYGSVTGEARDGNDDPQPVKFSRTTLRPVYVTLTLTTTDAFPLDGIAQVKAAIVAFGADYETNETVIALAVRASALAVAGVVDVPTFALGFAPAPVLAANLEPGRRARATFSSANLSVS
jgi:hypothetical protein